MTPRRRATRAGVFFWITVSLLAMLLFGGAAAALLAVFEAGNINRSGGWGWLLVVAIYAAVITVVCSLCALSTAISIARREPYRRLSIAILIISCFVVSALGPNLIRTVHRVWRPHADPTVTSAGGSREPTESPHPATDRPAADQRSKAFAIRDVENPGIVELKSKLWEAIRTNNADKFVDCFYVEDRFNTPEIRDENRNQVEILLRRKTIDVEILELPVKELAEIMKIQKAKSASQIGYSLVPGMMLRIQQEAGNGRLGRSFLIGERNGQWHIITVAGHLP